ncbi:hypothetical protein SBRCBS47491_009721, partial [Sporothrix bragantina]
MKILKDTLGGGEKNGGPAGDTEAEPSAAARQAQMVQLVKAGQEKIKKASKITNFVGQFIEHILMAKPLGDFVIQNVPQAAPAALPWASVCAALQILCKPANANKTNLEGVKYVVSRMEWYCALTDHLLDTGSIESGNTPTKDVLGILRERIVSIYRALLVFLIQSVCSYYSPQFPVFLKNLAGLEDWTASLKSIKDAESILQTDSDQYNKLHAKRALQECSDCAKGTMELLGNVDKTIRDYMAEQTRMKRTKTDRRILHQLFAVDPQDDMDLIEKKKDVLLYDAFKWILDMREFKAFTDDTNAGTPDDNHDGSYDDASIPVPPSPSSCRLLWIKGAPGTGKTMLLLGIIRELSARSATFNPSISHFFFQATEGKTLTSNTVALRSLLWMLLLQQPHLLSHLREKDGNAPLSFVDNRAFISLSKVFKSMLADPDLKPVYFIVDALDECDQGLPDLIGLISDSLALSDKVKWLVSSRPTVPLRTEEATKSLVELDSQKLKGPVAAYIHHQLSRLTIYDGYTKAIIDGISSEITLRAQNTFLWVWFIFQELTKPDKRGEMLNGSYALRTVQQFPPGLSALYGRVMDMIEEGRGDDPKYCKATLKAVYLAYRPLSLSELATLWDSCIQTLEGHNSWVASVVFSRDGKQLASGSYDKTVKVWDVASGECTQTLEGHNGGVASVVFSRDGKQLVSGSWDKTVKVWDVASGECTQTLEGHNDRVTSVVFSRDGKQLASSSYDNTVKVWDVASGGCTQTLEDHNGFVTSVVFSRDGKQLASGSDDKTVKVWDVASGECTQTLIRYNNLVTSVVFSRDGKQLASSSWDKTVKVWDVASGECTQTLEGHNDRVTSVVFSRDGKQLASGSYDNTVKVWDMASGECTQTLEGHNGGVMSVVFSRDGKQLASGSGDKTVKIWDVASGEYTQTLEGHNGEVTSVVFSRDGKQLASSSWDKTVKVWDIASGGCTQTLEGHNGEVTSIVFSRDGKQLASGSDDKTVKVWDVASGECTQTLEGHNGWVKSVIFSRDGKQLASSSGNNTVKVWDIASGGCTQTLEDHNGGVTSVVFSRDGKQLASGSYDKTVKVWDVASGECTQTLKRYNNLVTSVVFSRDGKQLASSSYDKTVKVWDIASGGCTQTLEGHNGS